jgi:hypothetical protein
MAASRHICVIDNKEEEEKEVCQTRMVSNTILSILMRSRNFIRDSYKIICWIQRKNERLCFMICHAV